MVKKKTKAVATKTAAGATKKTKEHELLDAIFDDEEADAPRLAWADWLTAQGNPWGEVVRTAVTLAAKGKKPTRALIKAQQEHRAAGLGPLADAFSPHPDDQRFDRGMLTGGGLDCGGGVALMSDRAWRGVCVYGGSGVTGGRNLAATASDPRWRGVRWIHAPAHSDLIAALGVAPAERLTSLFNLSGSEVVELARLPIAGRIEALTMYIYDDDVKKLRATTLEPFTSLDRLQIDDMTDAKYEGYKASSPTGRLLASKDLRARLRWLGELPARWLPWLLSELPGFASLEAVEFGLFELTRTKAGLELYLSTFHPGIEEYFARVPADAIAKLTISREVVLKRRTTRAAVTALAAQLGARLSIETAKNGLRERFGRWRWHLES